MPGKKASVPRAGDEAEVTIQSTAFGGDGVARHEGYVLFVPDVIPGERVRVRITRAKPSFGRAVALRGKRQSSRTGPHGDMCTS